MFELAQLKVLAALARRGSVTAAARELHYVQSTVSHHLARLEAEAGLRLTQRIGRGIRLTAAGELLAKRATEILGRMESARGELADLAELRTGVVRVAGFHSVLSGVLAEAAARFRATAPGVEVRLSDLHPAAALERLRAGEVEVAVVFGYDEATPEDVNLVPLFEDPMYLVSRTDGETVADHRDSGWIAGCPRCRGELVRLCAGHGFEPRIVCASDDPVVQQSLVSAGLGVTTMPGLALRTFRADGVRATRIPGLRRKIAVATFGDLPEPPATAAFVREVIAAGAGWD